jgi:2-polyprenyl-3-methyl-5-hydroxy-6-metoxy-1,4-benzoquinol methylase
MDQQIYTLHRENEKEHWWYKGRRKIISLLVKEFIVKKKKIKILDFGAGSGTNTIMLSKYGDVYVYEKDKKSQEYLKKKFDKINNIFVLERINKNDLFDFIVATDVIEHINDDETVIKILFNALKKDGNILLTVPAYNFLYNERDKLIGHFRRYNNKMLKNLTKEYFKIIKLSYYNFFLFPLSLILFVMIKIIKIKSFITSAEKTPNSILNNFLYRIFSSERFFLKYINFPFGNSIVFLAKKI